MDAYEILRIENLAFSYDGQSPVLRGVNLTVRSGESVAIMGRSGSGKTTLLKLVAGLLYPYEGRIITSVEAKRVGYVPQQIGLVKNLTALQNVLLGSLGRPAGPSRILGMFGKDEVRRAHELLDELGVGHLAERKAALLSGGERQRVAVARALMQSPSLLLADEFVSDLDVVNAMEIMRITSDMCRRKNVSVLMTMHDAFLVRDFADRAVLIGWGRVIKDIPAKQLEPNSLASLLTGDV
ncbi:MAG: ATP-binding cassette domain-containing protein [Nitrososphaerota archaeon]